MLDLTTDRSMTGTVRKDLQKLVKVGAIAKNGDGWEVLWNF